MPTLAQGWIDMNERIRQLAEQAGMIVGDAGEFDMAKFMPKEVKFAELIVRECADIAKKVDGDESDDYQSGRTWAGIDVLKHFGVEE
jgi:hypothetical protein